jgi:hypothetical protein
MNTASRDNKLAPSYMWPRSLAYILFPFLTFASCQVSCDSSSGIGNLDCGGSNSLPVGIWLFSVVLSAFTLWVAGGYVWRLFSIHLFYFLQLLLSTLLPPLVFALVISPFDLDGISWWLNKFYLSSFTQEEYLVFLFPLLLSMIITYFIELLITFMKSKQS